MPLETTSELPDGGRVRVRMPHASDRARLRDLHERLGLAARPLDLERVLRFDPRRRVIAVALAQDGAHERLAGYAAIDLGSSEPDLLVADEAMSPGVRAMLAAALRTRASGRAAA